MYFHFRIISVSRQKGDRTIANIVAVAVADYTQPFAAYQVDRHQDHGPSDPAYGLEGPG